MSSAVASQEIVSGDSVLGNRYEIRNAISNRAGMAAMRGIDRNTEQEVFIKTRNPNVDQNALMRISREADVLSSLDHLQIPAFVDADIEAEVPYIVTELYDHDQAVDERFKVVENPILAAEICLSVLGPLAYAHKKGLTHRDIKPRNLLVPWSGDVALSDWEIALCKDRKMASEIYTHQEYKEWRVTEFGNTWGSPEYMSPEQQQGRYCIPDARSDVYSLGVVLHFFLHGKMPQQAKSNEGIVTEIVADDIFCPDERFVPSTLQAIAERALQKKPEDRFQSAEEMAEAFERFLATA